MKKILYTMLTVVFFFTTLGAFAQWQPYEIARHAEINHDMMVARPELVDIFHLGFKSPSIWVRHYDDDGTTHQIPDCTIRPNWVYVKVENKTDFRTSGHDYLTINWTVATISPNVLRSGNGEYPTLAGLVGNNIPIPPLGPGESVIIKFPWEVPCPPDGVERIHNCFYARVNYFEGIDFSGTNPEIIWDSHGAWRNTYILNPEMGWPVGGKVLVGNFDDYPREFRLDLAQSPISLAVYERGFEPVFNRAKVFLTMDDAVLNAWERGGAMLEGIERIDWNKFQIYSNEANFGNIHMEPGEYGFVDLEFEFFDYNSEEYEYDLILRDAHDNKSVIGIQTFRLEKNDGSETKDASGWIGLAPNPTSDYLEIHTHFEGADNASIWITSTTNSYTYVYELNRNDYNVLDIDISHYEQGVYVVNLICNGMVVSSELLYKE